MPFGVRADYIQALVRVELHARDGSFARHRRERLLMEKNEDFVRIVDCISSSS